MLQEIKMSENKTIKSTELVEIINEFRKLEGKSELRHDTFMDKIRNEIEVLKSNKISLQNFMESTYINSRGKEYPCYELTKSGMLEMLNSESILVRCKTVEYIEKLEKQISLPTKTHIEEVNNAKAEIELMGVTANVLNFSDSSKLLLAHEIYKNNNISEKYLPEYVESKGVLKSATELLKANNIKMSAQKFNSILLEKGILQECTRQSRKDSNTIKKFKNLTNTEFGENLVNPRNSKETQPMYYENKFVNLLKYVGII